MPIISDYTRKKSGIYVTSVGYRWYIDKPKLPKRIKIVNSDGSPHPYSFITFNQIGAYWDKSLNGYMLYIPLSPKEEVRMIIRVPTFACKYANITVTGHVYVPKGVEVDLINTCVGFSNALHDQGCYFSMCGKRPVGLDTLGRITYTENVGPDLCEVYTGLIFYNSNDKPSYVAISGFEVTIPTAPFIYMPRLSWLFIPVEPNETVNIKYIFEGRNLGFSLDRLLYSLRMFIHSRALNESLESQLFNFKVSIYDTEIYNETNLTNHNVDRTIILKSSTGYTLNLSISNPNNNRIYVDMFTHIEALSNEPEQITVQDNYNIYHIFSTTSSSEISEKLFENILQTLRIKYVKMILSSVPTTGYAEIYTSRNRFLSYSRMLRLDNNMTQIEINNINELVNGIQLKYVSDGTNTLSGVLQIIGTIMYNTIII